MNSIIIIIFLLILIFLPFIFKKKEYYGTILTGKHKFNKQQSITKLSISFDDEKLKIIDIESDFFKDKKNLKILILSNNILGKGTSLNKNTFQLLEGLKELYLNNNLISSLGTGVFKGLNNLTKLDISNNKLTNTNIFSELKILKELDLSNNKITNLEKK